MNKFTIETPSYEFIKYNKQYMPFFIWDNKVYPIGARVTLTFHGSTQIGHCYGDYITLRDHFFAEDVECWRFENHYNDPNRRSKIRGTRQIETYNEDGTLYSHFIESVDAEPISTDCDEYLQFMEEYKRTYYDNHMTQAEYNQFCEKIKRGWSTDYALPERLRGRDLKELGVAPKHGSFTAPGAIGAWMVFIILIILAGIFKDWYMQLIARAFICWGFSGVINKKRWGFD